MALKKGSATLEVKAYPIDKLKPPDWNPRKALKQGDPEYEDIRRSISEFKFLQPLVYNTRTKTIVGGSQRWQVLKDLGYTVVSVVEVSLSAKDEVRLNLILNKVGGKWNEVKLKEALSLFDVTDMPFTGFNPEEVQAIVGYTDPSKAAPKDTRQEVPTTMPRIFQVVVMCKDEAQQTKVYNDLEKKGLDVKVVTI